jgi:hypothetical protein
MDAGIGRAAALAATVAAVCVAVAGARAQETVQPANSAPAAAAAPAENAAAANAVANAAVPDEDASDEAAPSLPPPPPTPVRAPVAVLRVLDKVTAETMAFAAPIGRRVRYKTLVFEVKACETRGVGAALPDPSAYVLITSDAGAAAGAALGPRQIFKGWMFANDPSLHALGHPVYDAWLVSCSTAAPAA